MFLKAFGCLSLAALAFGCAVGPNYHPPKTAMPARWGEPLAGGETDCAAALAQWWKQFNDAELNSLIERAIKSNLDLRVAEARVREARALRVAAFGGFLPTVDALGSYTKQRRSRNSLAFPVTKLDTDTYEVGFDANWEIDVFGGKRRALEAAKAEMASIVEDRRDVLVSLLAEVARNYVELRGFQQQLVIARQNIQSQQEAYEISRDRFRAGLVSELDVVQAKSLLATTQAQVPVLETSVKQSMHRLGVLLGQQPESMQQELSQDAPVPTTPPEVPVGLPADLLRRRADVRRAERDLAASNAKIGVAVADLFPKFTLMGTAGWQSLHTVNLIEPASKFWDVGPTITWRIFEAGQVWANIHAQNARQEQALALYQKTVLTSLEEVENALVAYAKEQNRHMSLQEAVAANQRAVELANERYTHGLTNFLNVLDARRSLYTSQDELAQSDRAIAANFIALYKALGGGWESLETSKPNAQKKPHELAHP